MAYSILYQVGLLYSYSTLCVFPSVPVLKAASHRRNVSVVSDDLPVRMSEHLREYLAGSVMYFSLPDETYFDKLPGWPKKDQSLYHSILFLGTLVSLQSVPVMVGEKIIELQSYACIPCINPIRFKSLRVSALPTDVPQAAATLKPAYTIYLLSHFEFYFVITGASAPPFVLP